MAKAAGTGSLLEVVVAWSPVAGIVHERVVHITAGASIADAIAAAGQKLQDGEKVGVWSKVRGLLDEVAPGDRVEIYRPLTVDPKVARRERFAQQGARHAGLFSKRRPNSKAGY